MKKALTHTDMLSSGGPPPERPRSSRSKLFIILLIVSLSLHLGFFVLMPWLFPINYPSKRAQEINVVFKERSQQEEKNKNLISLDQDNEIRPKKADFLAEKDHQALKEMKQEPLPEANDNLGGAPEDSLNEGLTKNDAPSIDDFLQSPHSQPKATKDPLGLRQGLPVLSPKSTHDYLADVKSGERTDINAWQWRHAPFFNRVKAAIGRIWAPNVQISRYDPRGALLGQKDRTTVMSVTIDQAGNLKDLKIADTSGVAYLDEEAERTFKAAAPFPFPPKELFENKDEFTFYFAFHIAISRGLSFDFEWQSPD